MAPDFPTSVHPPETNPQLPKNPCPYPDASIVDSDVIFRHSGWLPIRDKVHRALEVVYGQCPRLERFETCGTGAWVWRSATDDGHFKITADHCHDRWCLPCGRTRGRTIANNVLAYIQFKRLRFMTLTLRHRDEPLADSLDRLYNSFTKLRRSKDWRRYVNGGAAFVEIKHGLDRKTWHPHIHAIVEGRYYPHELLKAGWLKVTGDSYVVDIRPVTSDEHLLHYVTKYVSKPLHGSVYATEDTLQEAIIAMHGRRTCLTFASWRGLDLTTHDDATEWLSIGPLSIVMDQARAGDVAAQQAIIGLNLETATWDTNHETRAPPDAELPTT